MSLSLRPVITLAGLEAVLNSTDDGLQARITHVALGDSGYDPVNTATSLQNEISRISVSNGTRVNPTQIHITAVEDGSQEYWVREIGFILDDGTLLAVWSHPEIELAWKAVDVDLLLAFDMALTALPPDSVTIVGNGGVNLAPATKTNHGVVRLATDAEAQQGALDDAVVMNPKLCTIHGDIRYSKHMHEHDWDEIQGKPQYFPVQPHDHDSRYIKKTSFRVTSGFVATNNRYSSSGWAGYNDWSRNYADIYPPYGYTLSNLQGFIASIGVVYYRGEVDGNDSIWVRWMKQGAYVRVICNNSENRHTSYINYLAIWRK